MIWDIFISHATEDKTIVAGPLAKALRDIGYRVWYDTFELKLGDSLRQSIDRGIANSRFGVVALSRSFFGKKWTESELNGLSQLEVNGRKVILPIWYDISASNVRRYSPMLADRCAADWSNGIESVVREIVAVVGPPQTNGAESKLSLSVTEDVAAWRDPRFVRVGLSCGYLQLDSDKLQFSDRFLQAFSNESHIAIAQIEPSFGMPDQNQYDEIGGLDGVWANVLKDTTAVDDIWHNLKFVSVLRAKKIDALIGEDDLQYFLDQMGIPLTNYLTDVCVEAKLVTIAPSGAIEVDQSLLDELFGMMQYVKEVKQAKPIIVVSLVHLIEARLAIDMPQFLSARYLLAMFLYIVINIGPYVQAIEWTIAYDSKHRRMSFDDFLAKKLGKMKRGPKRKKR